ncbi:MAG: biotin--[acetyl-CoA-carboxylase] ligase [Isosphaeraceae bacterium]
MTAPLPFVRTVLHRPVVDSTSGLARCLLLQGVDELPLLVWADSQTLGKGQRDSSWWSDEGSLTFTVAIDPAVHRLRIDQEPRVSLAAAVAVIRAIDALGLVNPGIGIRWPNDVEVGGRKLGGILPERVETEHGHRLLVGIGLNVLTGFEHAPPDVARMATSLSALQPEPLDPTCRVRLLDEILSRLPGEIERLADDSADQAREWEGLNLLRGEHVRVSLGDRIVAGTVREIDPQGALCIDEGGAIQRLFGGQVLRDR